MSSDSKDVDIEVFKYASKEVFKYKGKFYRYGGICFLNKKTTLIAVILMFLQMTGTFLPLVILPEITFQNSNPLLPTLEGQYIIKNIIIITAALIIGRSYLKINLK